MLNAAVLQPESVAQLAQAFQVAQPYTHVVLRDICNRGALEQARKELINNVEAKFKETDLFKAPPPPHVPRDACIKVKTVVCSDGFNVPASCRCIRRGTWPTWMAWSPSWLPSCPRCFASATPCTPKTSARSWSGCGPLLSETPRVC